MEALELMEVLGERTNGDCYLGVVGPVRVGKSTFIRRFMEAVVLKHISDPEEKKRATDELPQAGSGKTITTTEPKFVPANAVTLKIKEDLDVKIRLIDCVGYIIDESIGYLEDGKMRLVKTPWFNDPIPFDEAAHIGTKKVIEEHSTIGIVVTSDGTIGDFDRQKYIKAEEDIVNSLKEIGKPFVIVLNTKTPGATQSQQLATELEEKYDCPVMLIDVENMQEKEGLELLNKALLEFPITSVALSLPTWVSNLDDSHYIKSSINQTLEQSMTEASKVKDVEKIIPTMLTNEYLSDAKVTNVDLGSGIVTITLDVKEDLYDKVLKELVGCEITDKSELIKVLSDFVKAKKEYDLLGNAIKMAEATGYGFASTSSQSMKIDKPEAFKTNNRYGIRVKANAPTYHIIKVNTTTSFEPILGSKEQSDFFLKYLTDAYDKCIDEMLECEMFGQKLKDVIQGGIVGKLSGLPEPVKLKLQQIIKTISNKGKGNLIAFVF